MTGKVVRGSIWTLVGSVLPLFVSLVATPFTVRLLGAEGYGIYALVALIPGYLTFADFGMSMASTRFGSAAFGDDDPEREARIIRTSALIALCVALPVAVAVLASADFIAAWLKIPDALEGEASTVIRLSSLILVLNFLSGIFNTPQLARLRMDLSALINTSVKILSQLGVPLIVYLGYGLVDAVWFLVAMTGVGSVLHVAVSSRLLPQLKGLSIDRDSVRPLLQFGMPLVGAAIAAALLMNGEKALVAASISTTALGYYSVAYSLSQVVTVASQSLIQSLIPAFSQLQSPELRVERNKLFSRGVRVSFMVVTPGIFMFALLARPFLQVWVGADFATNSVAPLYVLLVGLSLNIFAFIPYAAIISAGRTDVSNKIYWIEILPHFALVWVLTMKFGIVGAAAAWTLRAVADFVVQFVVAKRFAATEYSGSGFISFLPGPALMSAALICHFVFLDSNLLASFALMSIAIVFHFLIAARFVLDESELGFAIDRVRSIIK